MPKIKGGLREDENSPEMRLAVSYVRNNYTPKNNQSVTLLNLNLVHHTPFLSQNVLDIEHPHSKPKTRRHTFNKSIPSSSKLGTYSVKSCADQCGKVGL